MNKNMYWSPKKLLSYTDCDILIACGARGCGKTYGLNKYIIDKCIKYDRQFLYLRRYEEDFKNMSGFFNDVVKDELFPDYSFKVEKHKGWIKKKKDKKWRILCYFESISKGKSIKGVNYPQVYYIVFDEFQIDTTDRKTNRYIPGELRYFSDIVESFMRLRDGRVFMTSNSISSQNPYFTAWKIKTKNNETIKSILKDKKWNPETQSFENIELRIAVEMVENRDVFTKAKLNSVSGKISYFSGMGGSSVYNEYLNDNNAFIYKKPKGSYFMCNLVYNEKTYGVWIGKDEILGFSIFIDKNPQGGSRRTYCFKTSDIGEKNIFVKNYKQIPDITKLRDYVVNNKCYYSDQGVKMAAFEIFTILNIY